VTACTRVEVADVVAAQGVVDVGQLLEGGGGAMFVPRRAATWSRKPAIRVRAGAS